MPGFRTVWLLAGLLALLPLLGGSALGQVENAVRSVKVEDYTDRIIYHSPDTPGYTCWCTLWRAHDGSLRLVFNQITGPVNEPDKQKHSQPVLQSKDEARTWQLLREAPPGTFGHALVCLPDGTLVTGLWAGGGVDTGRVRISKDDGLTWSDDILLMDPVKYKVWPTIIRRLRDGRLVLVGGVWRRDPSMSWPNPKLKKVMFVSDDGGLTWGKPIWIMPMYVGLCEESDFAELPAGDLLFVHRTEHFRGSEYISSDRYQSIVRPRGNGWHVLPCVKAPFPHSGFPELLYTREGLVLHIATSGISWTADAGKSWHKLDIPGSAYYPRAMQLKDGRILVIGHVGSDNRYGDVDQAIRQQTFRLKLKR